MICNRCGVVMKNGTRYEQRDGKGSARQYKECPKCHERKYNNEESFQRSMEIELTKFVR